MATTTAPVPSPPWHLHASSGTSVAMPRGETGLPEAAVFHLRLTVARLPLGVTRYGDVDVPHGPHCIHRTVSYGRGDLFLPPPRRSRAVVTDGPHCIHWTVSYGRRDLFLGPPRRWRAVVTDLLHNFLYTVSPDVVEVSTFLTWVDAVSSIVSSTAVRARQAASCGVTTHVHICRVLQEGESGGGGGEIGRALLASRESYEREEGGFGGVPALESAIEALETSTYEGRVGKQDCPICLEELVGGQDVKRMPCGHQFHGGCIVDWLGKSHTCPLCRFPMPKRPPGIT